MEVIAMSARFSMFVVLLLCFWHGTHSARMLGAGGDPRVHELPPCKDVPGGIQNWDCYDPPSTPLPPCDFKLQNPGIDCRTDPPASKVTDDSVQTGLAVDAVIGRPVPSGPVPLPPHDCPPEGCLGVGNYPKQEALGTCPAFNIGIENHADGLAWQVQITNLCACSATNVILNCPNFSSGMQPIDPQVFTINGDGTCTVKKGKALAHGEVASFKYYQVMKQNLSVRSVNFGC